MWAFPSNALLWGGRARHLDGMFTDQSNFVVYQPRLSNPKDIDYSASLDSLVVLAPEDTGTANFCVVTSDTIHVPLWL